MWWCHVIDCLKFETRPSSLHNFEMANALFAVGSVCEEENNFACFCLSSVCVIIAAACPSRLAQPVYEKQVALGTNHLIGWILTKGTGNRMNLF